MALAQYPSQLPMPDLPGYQLNHISPLRRVDMASGRARQRRLFTSVPSMAQMTITMTNAEFQLFEGWFRWVIADGGDWFLGWAKTGLGVQHYEMRFAGMYQSAPISPREWQISATMEIRERQTLSALDMQFPDEITYSDLFDRTMNQHWPAS